MGRTSILGLAIALCSTGGQAAIIDVSFSGTFSAQESNPIVPVGTSYAGGFRYDSAAVPTTTSPFDARYNLISANVVVGGVSYAATGTASINDGAFESARFFLRLTDTSDLQFTLGYFTLPANSIQSFQLPSSAAFFTSASANGAFIDIDTPGRGNLFSTPVVSAAIVAVPEPAAWSLMILGFGAVGGALRRVKGVGAVASSRLG